MLGVGRAAEGAGEDTESAGEDTGVGRAKPPLVDDFHGDFTTIYRGLRWFKHQSGDVFVYWTHVNDGWLMISSGMKKDSLYIWDSKNPKEGIPTQTNQDSME